MSKSYWLTPEEAIQRKKRKKNLTYALIMIGTILFSTGLTILANHLY